MWYAEVQVCSQPASEGEGYLRSVPPSALARVPEADAYSRRLGNAGGAPSAPGGS